MSELPDNVEITEKLSQALDNFLSGKSYSSVMVLVDNNTSLHCYPLVQSVLNEHTTITITAGEKYKDLHTCQEIWDQMTQHQMDRKSLLVNLGGGVIGDMGGFCAATYKRGIDFINVPTTLLAQVDASIGGKLGVDFKGYKNHIGVFTDPRWVLVYPGFLSTLPLAEMRSGFAEVVKHSLISDHQYWTKISATSWEDQVWQEHITHSVKTKHRIVSEDPKEDHLRKTLNFGHTVGHAIERHYLQRPEPLLHGEAIAIGMICEAYLSSQKAGLAKSCLKEIIDYLLSVYGKHQILSHEFQLISSNTMQDKKNRGGQILCCLLKDLGEATYDNPISIHEIEESLDFYSSLTD